MIVKHYDFDVVLGMEFLLEHKVIVPLTKCLLIIGPTSTVVNTKIKQPYEIKMVLALQLKKILADQSV